MERDKYFSSLLYSICEGLNYFLRDPEENMSDDKKETITITTFTKWPFANDFRIETEDGKVLSVLCKCCSEVEYNDYMQEGPTLKSICFFRESVTYIHPSTFALHVSCRSAICQNM